MTEKSIQPTTEYGGSEENPSLFTPAKIKSMEPSTRTLNEDAKWVLVVTPLYFLRVVDTLGRIFN